MGFSACLALGFDWVFLRSVICRQGTLKSQDKSLFPSPLPFSPLNFSEWPRVAAPQGHAGSADPGDRNGFSTVAGECSASQPQSGFSPSFTSI